MALQYTSNIGDWKIGPSEKDIVFTGETEMETEPHLMTRYRQALASLVHCVPSKTTATYVHQINSSMKTLLFIWMRPCHVI